MYNNNYNYNNSNNYNVFLQKQKKSYLIIKD